MINDAQLQALALRHRVAPEVICTTCGRPSYSSAHHGHTVTRLIRPSRPVPTTTAAPKIRIQPPPPTEWVTVMDIAAELGVSKMTVYRLVNSREIESYRIGRSFRIKRAAFDAYLERARG